MVSVVTTELCWGKRAAVDSAYMDGNGCAPVTLYYKIRQQARPKGGSFPTSGKGRLEGILRSSGRLHKTQQQLLSLGKINWICEVQGTEIYFPSCKFSLS